MKARDYSLTNTLVFDTRSFRFSLRSEHTSGEKESDGNLLPKMKQGPNHNVYIWNAIFFIAEFHPLIILCSYLSATVSADETNKML